MRKRLCFILFALSVVFGVMAQNDTVVFSARGGFYDEVFSLELYHTQPQNHIRYTINGNRPTAQSPLYEEALVLDERCYSKSDIYTILDCPETEFFLPDSVSHCIVIRAAVFDVNDSCVSQVVTNSYFIHALGCDTHGLPVVSLCADSLALFDYETGIFVPGVYYEWWEPLYSGNYFQRGREWERLCNVEYYDMNNAGVNQQAGLRTHGGSSRRLQQKNLKIFAREEYGKKRFKHRFFPEIPIDGFKHLVLKPFCCSNGVMTGIQDALSQKIARNLRLDVLATRMTVLFINGEYWGIYALQETPDERYLEDHYDVDPEESNIIKNWKILEHGDSTNWTNLYQWVQETDFSLDENYLLMKERIDMDNFVDYWIFEMYSSNFDWPVQNTRCWQRGDGKWRWIFYDGDYCLTSYRSWVPKTIGTDENMDASMVLFTKFLANESFRNQFYQRYGTLFTHEFHSKNTNKIFRAGMKSIENEISPQFHRFGWDDNKERFDSLAVFLDDFLDLRLLSASALLYRLYYYNNWEYPESKSKKNVRFYEIESKRPTYLLRMARQFKDWRYVSAYFKYDRLRIKMEIRKMEIRKRIKNTRLWKKAQEIL